MMIRPLIKYRTVILLHLLFPGVWLACDDDKYLNPRIVADLEIIYGAHGVPIEYWYNETSGSSDHLSSVPGCPQSVDGFPWVYYGDPPKCYLTGHNGPCPDGELLLAQQGSLYGKCLCKCLMWASPLELEDSTSRYMYCGYAFPKETEQIYDKELAECYSKYEQGPCPENTLLISYNSTSLICLRMCNHEESLLVLDGKMQNRESCFVHHSYYPSIGGCGSGPQSIVQNECISADERFSEKLKKCVKRELRQRLVVGTIG